MKKNVLPFILLALIAANESFAQKEKPAQGIIKTDATLKNKKKATDKKELQIITAEKVMDMEMPEGGVNGASVAFHPKEKLYYAAQAGNTEFPLVVFNTNGKVISDKDQKTLTDVRGLWYNPKTKQLEGNAYKDMGWFAYELNAGGLPVKLHKKKEGSFQPDDNSTGVLDTNENEVLFLHGLSIVCYSTDGTSKRKSIQLHFAAMNANEGAALRRTNFEQTYNSRSIVYTGTIGAEIGLLNVVKKEVELYDIKSGYMSRVIKLPIDFEIDACFNFSYANGIYWVFDKQKRKWNGYR